MIKIQLFIIFIVLYSSYQELISNNFDIVTSTSSSGANAQTTIGNSQATAISSAITNNQDIIQILDSDSNVVSTGFIDDVFPSPTLLDSSAIINPDSAIVVGQCITTKWTTTKQQAIDIGVSSRGDLYSVSLDGKLYQYNFISNTWANMLNSDNQYIYISRVAVSYDGTPYIITQSGETYYNNCDREWVRLQGCAIDIGIGKNGDIYKIGCDSQENGFGIYKLICNQEGGNLNMKKQTCNRAKRWWRCPGCNKHKEEKNCSWFKVDGAGVRIAVSPKGNPVVVGLNGDIMVFNDENWVALVRGANARDIDISNDGEVFYNDSEMRIFKVGRGYTIPSQLCGGAKAITVGPYGQPFVIGNDYMILSSSKQCFN